jgi:hypothetical protein
MAVVKKFSIIDVFTASLKLYWEHIFFCAYFFAWYIGSMTAALFGLDWLLFGYQSSMGQKIIEFYHALWTSATTGSLLFPYSELSEFLHSMWSEYNWQLLILFAGLFMVHTYFSLKITQASLEMYDETCCSRIVWFTNLTTLVRGFLGLFVYDIVFNSFDIGVGSLPELVQIILGSPLLLVKVSLLTMFSFYEHIIVDQHVSVVKAFTISSRVMRGVGVKMWIFLAIMESLNAFIFIFMPILWLVTWPCSYIALAYLYRKFQAKTPKHVV